MVPIAREIAWIAVGASAPLVLPKHPSAPTDAKTDPVNELIGEALPNYKPTAATTVQNVRPQSVLPFPTEMGCPQAQQQQFWGGDPASTKPPPARSAVPAKDNPPEIELRRLPGIHEKGRSLGGLHLRPTLSPKEINAQTPSPTDREWLPL